MERKIYQLEAQIASLAARASQPTFTERICYGVTKGTLGAYNMAKVKVFNHGIEQEVMAKEVGLLSSGETIVANQKVILGWTSMEGGPNGVGSGTWIFLAIACQTSSQQPPIPPGGFELPPAANAPLRLLDEYRRRQAAHRSRAEDDYGRHSTSVLVTGLRPDGPAPP